MTPAAFFSLLAVVAVSFEAPVAASGALVSLGAPFLS
jgi:hypothetical protein